MKPSQVSPCPRSPEVSKDTPFSPLPCIRYACRDPPAAWSAVSPAARRVPLGQRAPPPSFGQNACFLAPQRPHFSDGQQWAGPSAGGVCGHSLYKATVDDFIAQSHFNCVHLVCLADTNTRGGAPSGYRQGAVHPGPGAGGHAGQLCPEPCGAGCSVGLHARRVRWGHGPPTSHSTLLCKRHHSESDRTELELPLRT